MDSSTFDINTLTLLVAIMGSTLTAIILMRRRFKRPGAKIDAMLDGIDTGTAGLETRVSSRDARFDGINTRINGRINGRFDGIDDRFDRVDARLDRLEARFDAMGRDLSHARERLAWIEGYVLGPESFRPRNHRSPAPDKPALEHHKRR